MVILAIFRNKPGTKRKYSFRAMSRFRLQTGLVPLLSGASWKRWSQTRDA